MANARDTFSPIGWRPMEARGGAAVPGVWAKDLRRAHKGDNFVLVRFDVGAIYPLPNDIPRQLLIIEGGLEDAVVENGKRRTESYTKGGYLDCAPSAQHHLKSQSGCMALLTF